MYKRGGRRRGGVARLADSPSPSSASSPSLSSCPSLSSNPQLELHAAGHHGHIGTSSDSQQLARIDPSFNPLHHMRGQVYQRQPVKNVIPPSLEEQSNDKGNTGEGDHRFLIQPYGDSFTDDTYVVRALSQIVNKYWRGPYITYSSVPKEVNDLWWDEFKRQFRWAETDEDEVRRNFKKKASDHVRNVINKAKRRQVKPLFITSDDWAEIKKTWETKKHKQVSEWNKQNQASCSSEGSTTHAGGSINIRKHKKRMVKELGNELFPKKKKTWTSDRAKAIKENFDELSMSNAYSGDGVAASDQSADQTALWVEASGGIKRGKIYGMGSLSREYARNYAAMSSSSVADSRRRRKDSQLAQELSHLEDLNVQQDKKLRALERKMQRVMRHLNIQDVEVPLVPPTNPIGDEHNDDGIATSQPPSR